jgi:transcriptional regulator with XRE-family HTH domain
MDYNNVSEKAYLADSHPIDKYVGSRVKLRRTLLGLAQQQLAKALGLTFQQVQKYESGVNRIGASRLFQLSLILSVPISYFYDEMPEAISNGPPSGPRGRALEPLINSSMSGKSLDDSLGSRESVDLLRSYYRIEDKVRRKIVLDLVHSLATPNDICV